ncbi:hypothetical protein CDAR_523601 [Caerostris darwini]|uniref:Uncharacterized protein n=1 Tax=Caerostris darwini TaxID=1538125 RepID=A0AAV4UMX9_9ARAC|nr:hypothetical protein CDAR_523601 [Caerostris darwini]
MSPFPGPFVRFIINVGRPYSAGRMPILTTPFVDKRMHHRSGNDAKRKAGASNCCLTTQKVCVESFSIYVIPSLAKQITANYDDIEITKTIT